MPLELAFYLDSNLWIVGTVAEWSKALLVRENKQNKTIPTRQPLKYLGPLGWYTV